MSWDAIGAIGEIVGAFAVILSLLYLAKQIKIQNNESRIAAMHDISVGFREAVSRFASEDMSRIIVKGNSDTEQLTDDEALRFLILAGQFFRAWEEAFIQFEEGHLSERNWLPIHKYYITIMNAPAIQHAWSLRSHCFDEEFSKYVGSQDYTKYKYR